MTSLDIQWLAIFADVPAEYYERAIGYWQAVTGAGIGDPVGDVDQYLPFEPADGDRYVWLQRVGRQVGGWHLDLYVPELAPARDTATELGAALVQQDDDVVVCSTPAGQPFCLVREYRDTRRRAAPATWDSGRSEVDQICFDIPAAGYEAEVEFWSALTGWPRDAGELPEFENLVVPPTMPLRVLLQRLGADDSDGVRAHADMSADERAAEVARHEAFGGEVAVVSQHWTTLHDPAGLRYCVTDRFPHPA